MADDQTFVIVGASVAGARAAITLRERGFGGRVVLVGAEAAIPYERPPLSKGILLGEAEPDSAQVEPPDWYEEHDVELRLGVAATALDPAAHTVTLGGGERVAYDRLLLATGSVPRRLEVPGAELDGIYYLRSLPESLALRAALQPNARVVLVGGGWIGLEVAAAARHHDAQVTVIEPQAQPLVGIVGPELGAMFAALHVEHGVDLRLGQGVESITGENGSVTGVVTSSGAHVPADAVVVGVGVRPATELAEAAGLAVDNGILTDASMRTSAPDVFAAGDVANTERTALGGRRVRVDHWANAFDGGPVAARAMLGEDATFDALPFFFSDQYDLGLEYAGYVGRDDDARVVIRGDLAGRELVAFWLAPDNRVLAGMNVNVWDVNDTIQALVRSGRAVDPARLADLSVPLDEV